MIRFSELVNMVILTGAAVVLLGIIFRNNNAILWLDVRLLLGCMMVMALRLFILADSPVASNIPIFNVYAEICWFLRDTLFYWKGMSVSIMMLLQVLWVAGGIVSALYRIHGYAMTHRQIRRYRRLRKPEFAEAVRRINAELGRKAEFRIVTSKRLGTPCIFGVFRPYIGIPEMELKPEEIYLVMKHEMLHYYRGDMIIKILCEALKAVYWWNPFVYMLGDLVSSMQEINVDFRIVRGLSEMEQLEYVDCLAKVARHRVKRKRENRWEISFRKESPSEVHKRINLMIKNQEISGKKTTASFLLSAGILCMIALCPNIMTFEPYAIPEEKIEGSVGVKGGGICCLDNKNGTYDVYVDGQYFTTVEELFDEHIPVYNTLEEAMGMESR